MRDLPLRLHSRSASMNQLFGEQLTQADIRILAASIYEPQPRLWTEDRWCCPQCLKPNPEAAVQCSCGISRDGLPEFCER